jgi:capsular exopolysaccharide synthesis family protein
MGTDGVEGARNGDTVNLRQVLATLRAAWWIPVVALTVGGVAAVGVNAVITPRYTAETQLFVSVGEGSSTSEVLQGTQLSQERVASYTQLLTGVELARRVIGELDLREEPEDLAERVMATTRPETVLIDVAVEDTSPEQAQRIAQAIADVFPEMVSDLETAGVHAAPIAVTVVNPPALPTEPSSPNATRNIAMAALTGLLIGVGAVLLRERLDRTVKAPAQAEALSSAPVIGVVVRDREIETGHVIAAGTQSASGESYRQVRTNLQFLSVDSPPKTIMVTSPMPSEGKTTLVVNLARVLADAGRRVLVLEADLRRPTMSRYLGLVGGVGVTAVLTGAADIEEVVQTYAHGPFSVIAGGATPPNPGELLMSEAMSDLLLKLREEYDIVLVDAPPVLAVADTAGFAPMVDGVLLSVRYGGTRTDQLQQAATALSRVGAKTLGVVLNLVPPSADIAAVQEYGYASPPPGTAE